MDSAEEAWAKESGHAVEIKGKVEGLPAAAADSTTVRIRWSDHRPRAQRESADSPGDLRAPLNRRGEFLIGVDPRQWLLFRPYSMLVENQQAGVLYRGLVTLDYFVQIQVPPVRELKGQVVTSRSLSNAKVALIGLDDWENGRSSLLARADLGPDGRFSAAGRVRARHRWVSVGIQAEAFRATARVRIEDLLSDAGARIPVDLHAIDILVRDSKGNVTNRADVQAWVQPVSGKPWKTASAAMAGQAYRLLLQPGRCQVCVTLPDHLAHVLDLPVDGDGPATSEHVVELSRLNRRDVIIGSVVNRHGQPREGVTVSCYPYTGLLDIALAAKQSTHTDSAGRFSVPRCSTGEVLLVADDFVKSSLWTTVHGGFFDTEPVLVLPETGRLRVTYRQPSAPMDADAAPDYVIVDRSGQDATPHRGRLTRGVTTVSIGAGEYRVFVATASRRQCGVTDVRVERDDSTSACVLLGPCMTVRGRIVSAEGAVIPDATIELLHPTVPESIVEDWFRTRTAADGRFELHCLDLEGTRFFIRSKVAEMTIADPGGGDVVFRADR